MNRSRLEAFSDGVIAVIITIMVLELKVPHSAEFSDLLSLYPVFLSYVLSFLSTGLRWSNHHHLLHTVKNVTGRILLANLHFLFWISLVPFTTAWMGENHFAEAPTQLYIINLIVAAIAYRILIFTIIKSQGPDSILKNAVGNEKKGIVSMIFYVIAFAITYFSVTLAQLLIFMLVFIWIIPDKRIEKALNDKANIK